jgi:hypothetical protein
MDLSKLNALSTDTLRDMNAAICQIIRHRQTQVQLAAGSKFRIGQRAMFVSKYGHLVNVVIDKINAKSINCTEVDASGKRLMKTWRVSPSLLRSDEEMHATVKAMGIKPAPPASRSDRPVTPGGGW